MNSVVLLLFIIIMKARIKKRGLPFRGVTAVKFEGQEGWFSADDVEFEYEDTSYWATIRYEAAIAAMQGTITILSSPDRYAFREVVVEGFRGEQKTYPNEIAQFSVAVADALIIELKRSSADEVAGDRNKEWAMSVLDFKITNCALSVRTMNLLKSAGIDTIGELVGVSKSDLLKSTAFGKKSVGEIEDFLAGIGLKLMGE